VAINPPRNRRQQKARADKARDSMLHRLRRQRRPHIVLASVAAAGTAVHGLATATGSRGSIAAIVALTTAVVAAIAYATPKLPRTATPYLAGAGAWIALVALAGMSWGMLLLLLVAGYAAALPYWRRHRIPDPTASPEPQPAADTTSPATLWAANIADSGPLAQSYLTNPQPTPTGVRCDLHLRPGKQNRGKVLGMLPDLRTGLLLEPGQDLIVERHPRLNESILSLTIVRKSQVLSTDQPWPGPTYNPKKGTIDLGPYVDGDGTAAWRLHGQPYRLYNGFLTGSTDSGKSRLLEAIAVGAATAGCVIWFGDPQGGASSAFLFKHADRRGGSVAEVRQMLREAQSVKNLRQVENALYELEGWSPTEKLPDGLCRPGLAIVIDECHNIFSDPECLALADELAREGGKVGVAIIAASQVATLDAFGGQDSLRSSLVAGNLVLMRTESNNTRNVLSGVSVDPTEFPPIPGYGFLEDKTRERRSAPFRGYYFTDAARIEWGPKIQWLELDAGAANAAGDSYVHRREEAEANRAGLADRLAAMRAGKVQPGRQEPAEAASAAEPLKPLVPYRPPSWPPEGPAQQEGGNAGAAVRRTAPDVIYDLVAQGVTSPGELEKRSGYSGTAVRNALKQLEKRGRVQNPQHGTWTTTHR